MSFIGQPADAIQKEDREARVAWAMMMQRGRLENSDRDQGTDSTRREGRGTAGGWSEENVREKTGHGSGKGRGKLKVGEREGEGGLCLSYSCYEIL